MSCLHLFSGCGTGQNYRRGRSGNEIKIISEPHRLGEKREMVSIS